MLSPYAKVVAAIPDALGAPAPPNVNCGSIADDGRVAWIEIRGEIAFARAAAGGRLLFERSLAVTKNNPRCVAEEIGWIDGRVAAITREGDDTRFLLFPRDGGDPDVRIISPVRLMLADALVWAGEEPGLLRVIKLPELSLLTPLCFRGHKRNLSLGHLGKSPVISVEERLGIAEWKPIDTLVLPSPAQRALPPHVLEGDDFFTLVEHALHEGEPAPPLARLVVESTALPFCRAPEPRWRPALAWLPVHWHRHLAATGHDAEANELLALLDALAAPLPESESEEGWNGGESWDAVEGATILATRHVRRQARLLAATCREGKLPAGWWDYLFASAPGSDVVGSLIAPATLPQTARRVFEELVATKPPEIPTTG